MSQDKIFSEKYSEPENETSTSNNVSECTTLEIEEKKYGLNKPQRIIISGKLKHGKDD